MNYATYVNGLNRYYNTAHAILIDADVSSLVRRKKLNDLYKCWKTSMRKIYERKYTKKNRVCSFKDCNNECMSSKFVCKEHWTNLTTWKST